jgi:transcription-repair coupling factor (superfamily II helicase)
MEIMIPEEYVANISERIRLYKELNEIKSEEDIRLFEERLSDRFGNLPLAAIDLLQLVRLRWSAIKLSIEKIILKKSLMICHFVSDPNSGFYSSKQFGNIIVHVNNLGRSVKMKQDESRLTLTFREVADITTALKFASDMVEEVTVTVEL